MKTPVRQTPLVVQVTEQFRALIEDGSWPVGVRIPAELQLVQDLGVSRSTVREALRSLASAGLLQPRVGDGTYVIARDDLAALLARGDELQDLQQVLDVRSILDVAAASWAANRRTTADVQSMRRALAARRKAHDRDDRAAYVTADVELHRSVVQASGNALLLRLYDAFIDVVTEAVDSTTTLPEDPRLGELHRELVDAIEAHDGGRAADTAAELVREVQSADRHAS
ncbi:FadR/GntR family transcriptional regulator [Rudaeicoccus suwonensis]|uniref:GntR family transcriptional regulator n=1 Tax=Rudaeicoccus suwonensis TaxID=657409 RepID=A0A561E1A0_9MICO|nr:FCD domain-containing protein [Rudaeicoccus suwonensis]TWE09384.1 GntR family transcriptional regulator [Rudaeicoccus suwonensis]